jgi:hypothetical protein
MTDRGQCGLRRIGREGLHEQDGTQLGKLGFKRLQTGLCIMELG